MVTGKYTEAITKANYVIGGKYKLATGDDYVDMWYDENVDELIFTPFVNKDEISTPTSFSTAQGWNYWWPGNTAQCDYIPTQESVLSLAEFEDAEGYINDVRFESFVANIPVAVEGGTTKGYAFVKYPGNPSLNSSSTNYYMNTPKPFRLSEQYLIKAEAAALSDDPNTANSAISDLVKARLYDTEGFAPLNLSGSALLTFIRNERSKELMGEGFRLSDLRRWRQGFDRNQSYALNPYIAETRSVVALSVRYSDDDYRYVWPIPASEMEINPQLANQQNPEY